MIALVAASTRLTAAASVDGTSITSHRARLAYGSEANEVSEDDLLTASRPGTPRQESTLLSAPPLLGYEASVIVQPTATCTLGTHPESVKTGRDFARVTLSLWDMSELADVAELVVSELVTNALRHGVPVARRLASDHCVRLRLLAEAPFVMCMVADPGHEIPVLQDADPAAESGRGLTVVEACCVRWGWHLLDEGGKVVWALLR
jgi:anti-sigma regulatory factor (Ser/Thr protein kinase)